MPGPPVRCPDLLRRAVRKAEIYPQLPRERGKHEGVHSAKRAAYLPPRSFARATRTPQVAAPLAGLLFASRNHSLVDLGASSTNEGKTWMSYWIDARARGEVRPTVANWDGRKPICAA